MNISNRNNLILITLLALILSLFWTYKSVQAKRNNLEPVEELFVTIKPDYRIISKQDVSLWPAGTEFEQGLVTYFYATWPEIIVTPTVTISGLKSGYLEGKIQVRGLVRAINDKSQVYWSFQMSENFAENIIISLESTGSAEKAHFKGPGLSLDVVSAYNLATQIREELQFQTGFFQLVIEIVVNIDGTANDVQLKREIVQELPISLQTNSFSLGKTDDVAAKIGLIQNAITSVNHLSLLNIIQENPFQAIVSASLLLLMLVLISLGSIEKTKTAMEHKRYKEWITEGNVEVHGKLQVDIISLQGLVDLAIDIDKRVIYDIKSNKYYVLTEDIVYVYDRERANALLDNKQQFGRLLLNQGLVTPEQLETGLYYQQKAGIKLGQALIALGFLNEATLYSTLAAQYNLNYYEINPSTFSNDLEWLKKLTVPQARVLKVLPLGQRGDGRVVIATSEVTNKGIEETLKEIFESNIEIVGTRPSRIFEILDRIEIQEYEKIQKTAENKARPYQRLSKEELEQFIKSYQKGIIEQEVFLKAAGFYNKKTTNIETLNLVIGLDRAIKTMSWNERKDNKVPQILELLLSSNYLTEETIGWIKDEVNGNEDLLEHFFSINYIVSKNTLQNIKLILYTLESILYQQ